MSALHYVRCALCLSVAAVVGKPAETLTCECGGKVRTMGRVLGNHFRVSKGHDTPCDARCTHATGPRCDCPCGGVNHGIGKVVEVVVIKGIPQILSANPARAVEFTAALKEARARAVNKTVGSSRARDAATFDINHAKRMRSHSGRMRALAAVCAEVAP